VIRGVFQGGGGEAKVVRSAFPMDVDRIHAEMNEQAAILIILLLPLLKAFHRAAMLFLRQGVEPAIEQLVDYERQTQR
jgi:hypothetical protein